MQVGIREFIQNSKLSVCEQCRIIENVGFRKILKILQPANFEKNATHHKLRIFFQNPKTVPNVANGKLRSSINIYRKFWTSGISPVLATGKIRNTALSGEWIRKLCTKQNKANIGILSKSAKTKTVNNVSCLYSFGRREFLQYPHR